jgi:phosphoribosylformylglycinamidine synthase
VAAIGGKDSMSGTFEGMDVPPTLVSFAVAAGRASHVISPEFNAAGSRLCYLYANPFDGPAFTGMLSLLHRLIAEGKVVAAWAAGKSGIAEGLFKMALGNGIGARVADGFAPDLFAQAVGGVVVELAHGAQDAALDAACTPLGETVADYAITCRGMRADMAAVQAAYENRLEPVFPRRAAGMAQGGAVPMPTYAVSSWPAPALRTARPVAVIPTFPGTNCEVDTARALARAGAQPHIVLIRNLSADDIRRSVEEACKAIGGAQMLVFPGGFSGGDEPDGSGKFITAFFRNPAMLAAVDGLLHRRDGLALGICNGFQALVKLGLVPFGRIIDTDEHCPTLTYNRIGRHQSMLVRTRVASNLSPWLQKCAVGDVHTVAVSHGEGRFVCSEAMLAELAANGQIATQYVGLDGLAAMDGRVNPNGSVWAVEGITSPDGRVLGKMGHSERSGRGLYRNVPGNLFQPLFEGGVAYFR